MQTANMTELISTPLYAVAGTSIVHNFAKDSGGVLVPKLTPTATPPVFQLPDGVEVDEVVAVCYRNAKGLPVHGAMFGVSGSSIAKISLVDRDRKVDTDCDPAFIAIGMTMMIGDLFVRGLGLTKSVPWSIIDVTQGSAMKISNPSAARTSVLNAYLERVLPFAVIPDFKQSYRTLSESINSLPKTFSLDSFKA